MGQSNLLGLPIGGFGQRIDPDPFDAALEQQLGWGSNDLLAILGMCNLETRIVRTIPLEPLS